jgi:LuxR family quorum sensing-dependent transcriptional regulator
MNSSFRWNLVLDTIEDMSRLTSVANVGARLEGAAEKFGFTSFGINGLPPLNEAANPVILTELTPTDFRDCYVAEGCYLVDHICAHARSSYQTFRYSEAPYAPSQARVHVRFLQFLDTYGMGPGLIVPVGRPAHIPACVWLGGEKPDLDDDTCYAVQMIASFAASKAQLLSRPAATGTGKLTAREREVLQWISTGKTSWEIGEILHIAKRTVDEHVRRAIRKTNAANRTHAVALAVRDGLIDL